MLKIDSQKLIKYRKIIILIWWIVILLLFKFINNFIFNNGSSILFIFLVAIVPLFLNILAKRRMTRLKAQKEIKKKSYFDLIQYDIKNGIFQHYFINKILKLKLKLSFEVLENQVDLIIGEQQKIYLNFNEQKAFLQIVDTLIIYRFYYTRSFDELTKYDMRGLEYHSTNHLYQALLSIIKKLTSESLRYEEITYGKKIVGYYLYQGDDILYQIKEKKQYRPFTKERKTLKEIQF